MCIISATHAHHMHIACASHAHHIHDTCTSHESNYFAHRLHCIGVKAHVKVTPCFTDGNTRMCTVWTPCGHHVDTAWTPHWHHVDTTCTPHWHHVDTTCTPHVHHYWALYRPNCKPIILPRVKPNQNQHSILRIPLKRIITFAEIKCLLNESGGNFKEIIYILNILIRMTNDFVPKQVNFFSCLSNLESHKHVKGGFK